MNNIFKIQHLRDHDWSPCPSILNRRPGNTAEDYDTQKLKLGLHYADSSLCADLQLSPLEMCAVFIYKEAKWGCGQLPLQHSPTGEVLPVKRSVSRFFCSVRGWNSWPDQTSLVLPVCDICVLILDWFPNSWRNSLRFFPLISLLRLGVVGENLLLRLKRVPWVSPKSFITETMAHTNSTQ